MVVAVVVNVVVVARVVLAAVGVVHRGLIAVRPRNSAAF